MSESKSFKTISIVALVVLTALAGFLLLDRSQIKSQLTEKSAMLSEINATYEAVDAEFTLAKAELDNMKSDNVELNTLIETQKEELEEQRKRINGLIRQNKNLKEVEQELAAVRTRVSGYLKEIDDLRSENEMLAQANFDLKKNNEILTEQYTAASIENEELVNARAVLMSENEGLASKASSLSAKVKRASALTTNSIEVQGFKVRNNGKLAKKDKAKKVDLLQVCFNAPINPIVEQGNENFYIRIVNPIGETLALENKGSGTISLQNGEDVRFTQMTEVPYEMEELSECVTWQSEIPFQKGTYQILVYNKGYEVGQTTYELK